MQNETNPPNWDQHIEEDADAAENQPAETAEAEEVPAVEDPAPQPVDEAPQEIDAEPAGEPASPAARESGFTRFLRFLFGADTRVGRVMRPLLRGAALFMIAFGFGLLAAYFVMYQPMRAQYDAAFNDVKALAVQLNDANTSITALEEEQKAMQSTLALQQEEIDLSNYRVYFLIAKNDVLRARLALADTSDGPGGPAALAALNELETHLADLLPYVEADDPVLANLLTSRLDVVQAELVRDSGQAKVELESFYSNLLELEDTLFE